MIHYLVDIGNSAIKAGCVLAQQKDSKSGAHLPNLANEPIRLSLPSRLSSSSGPTSFDTRDLVVQLTNSVIDSRLTASNDVSASEDQMTARWWISSVRGDVLRELTESILQHDASAKIKSVNHLDIPIRMQVDVPERVGIDRVLAAFGANRFASRENILNQTKCCIVIQAGTAVTVDLVCNDEYCGGAIMPGIPLSMHLLAAGTDQLPNVTDRNFFQEPVLPGKNTADAMHLGVSSALRGGVARLVHQYRQLSDAAHPNDVPVIFSGGDGQFACEEIDGNKWHIDEIVLRSLAEIAFR